MLTWGAFAMIGKFIYIVVEDDKLHSAYPSRAAAVDVARTLAAELGTVEEDGECIYAMSSYGFCVEVFHIVEVPYNESAVSGY